MSGTKAQQAREMMAGVCPARAEQRKPPGATSAAAGRSLTSALLGVPSTAGSQRRRPNARWAAVGEASEASQDADVTVTNAHAQRHGCLSARWAQTRHACYRHGTHFEIDQQNAVFRETTLTASGHRRSAGNDFAVRAAVARAHDTARECRLACAIGHGRRARHPDSGIRATSRSRAHQ